ncbi:MAG TPA: tail sheath stabilizer and completion protein, partial [Methanosarcina sp.]|nr:tail sheath stabilizer and completion protein [Methanosarcina sp.]
FTDLEFERKDNDGNIQQVIKVPVSPGHFEKWLKRIQEDPNLSGRTQITLPRIGFELVSLGYDASRKIATMNQFTGNQTGNLNDYSSAYTPVPYNLNLQLYISTKTQGDALQILEQILPFFCPGYTVTIDMFPEVGISQDVPFILQGVEMQDNYDGSFEQKRMVTYTLSFVAKVNLLGPIKSGGSPILHTRIKISDYNAPIEEHHWDVNNDGSITGEWIDLE